MHSRSTRTGGQCCVGRRCRAMTTGPLRLERQLREGARGLNHRGVTKSDDPVTGDLRLNDMARSASGISLVDMPQLAVALSTGFVMTRWRVRMVPARPRSPSVIRAVVPAKAPHPADGPRSTTTYIICTNPRSGSWLLAEGLAGTSIAGNPREWFNVQQEQATRAQWRIDNATDLTFEGYLHKVNRWGRALPRRV